MKINTAKNVITIHEKIFEGNSSINQALEVALDCMTLVQNLEAIYKSTEESLFAIDEILEKFFERDGEIC